MSSTEESMAMISIWSGPMALAPRKPQSTAQGKK
jgi:hypothetical protein